MPYLNVVINQMPDYSPPIWQIILGGTAGIAVGCIIVVAVQVGWYFWREKHERD